MSAILGSRRSTPARSTPAAAQGEGEPLCRLGDVLAGRYEIREAIGSGPLGAVYRAESRSNGVAVALRIVWPDLLPDDAARGRFLRLTTRARSISNRYVAPLVEAFVDEVAGQAVCVLVGKHIAGPTLASRVARRLRHGVPLLAMEAQPIVSQIGVGLSAIHAAGLVHGNLHLGNVFLIGDEARIADLGVAASLPPNIVALAERQAGRARPCAPEVAAGRSCSPPGDVYALAVVTGQMLGLFGKRTRAEAPVPASVKAVLRRALSAQAADRYGDVDTFAGALVTAFERADQRAAIGLRAVEPAGGLATREGSALDDQAPVAGALEIPSATPAVRGRRGNTAASVVVDDADGGSRTPATLPPVPRAGVTRPTMRPTASAAMRPAASPAIRPTTRQTMRPAASPMAHPAAPRPPAPRASRPQMLVPPSPPPARSMPRPVPAAALAAREAIFRERPPARVPTVVMVALIAAAAFLGGAIARNVITARFEEQVARARVEKADLLRHARAEFATPAAPADAPGTRP